MGSFYEEIEATRARNDEALASYERACASHANRIRSGLQQALGWPDAQLALVDFDEPPDGARRAHPAGEFGHVSRNGFHFGLKVSGLADWHIVFYWTMRLLPSQKVELEGDPDEPGQAVVLDLADASPAATEPLAAYVREKIRAFVDRFTLAALVGARA